MCVHEPNVPGACHGATARKRGFIILSAYCRTAHTLYTRSRMLLARVAALRVAGRVPVAGRFDGRDLLLCRRSMRVCVAVCVRACKGNGISVSLTPVAVAARAIMVAPRRPRRVSRLGTITYREHTECSNTMGETAVKTGVSLMHRTGSGSSGLLHHGSSSIPYTSDSHAAPHRHYVHIRLSCISSGTRFRRGRG